MAKSTRSARNLTLPQRLRTAIDVFKASGQWTPQSINDLDKWMDASAVGRSPSAMAFTAYFSGVMQISQTLASVPFPLFKKEGLKRRALWYKHPVYKMLNSMANPYVNASKWRECAQMQMLNFGDSYSQILRDTYYRPYAAYLLDPARMRTEVEDSGEPVYLYRKQGGGERRFRPDEIFHLSGFGPDVYTGYSVIELFSKATSLGLSQENFMLNFIEKGVHTSGVASHPETLSAEAKKGLRESIQAVYAGSDNAGRVLVLEEGMTWQTFSMPLKDAEMLGSRVFQIQEIARILNMPPHKLKELTNATYSNIEHQQIEWITDTIRPHSERWEIAVDTQLLSPIEREKGFSQHALDQIQRGDMKSMIEAQRIGRFAGFFSADQALENLGMNPLEDEEIGSRLWQPSNMMNAASEAARNGGGTTGVTSGDGQGGDDNEEE